MKLSSNSKRHISHRGSEIHVDRYNIDFMRYFGVDRCAFGLLGSLVGLLAWYYLLGHATTSHVNSLYLLYIVAGPLFFYLTSLIVYHAGNTRFESLRVAVRRALFTFNVILLTTLAFLASTGLISWSQQFYFFVQVTLTAMIPAGIGAVLLDYGITFLKGLRK